MRPLADSSATTADAHLTLDGYLRGALTLDELIEWAERLESNPPGDDPWLRRVVADLANPLLCREQATALVQEHLRAWRSNGGYSREKGLGGKTSAC